MSVGRNGWSRLAVAAAGMLLAWGISARAAGAQAAASAAAGESAARTIVHGITNDVSVELPVAWSEFNPGDAPAALGPYAPPFHLGGILALQDLPENAIVQFATSDNPLLGRDAKWLDGQLHMPSGSGMSLVDFLFYYFFPPSASCIDEALANNARASFAASPNKSSSDAPPVLQVTYACRHDMTLQGFFGSQVSSGITFVQTNEGPRAYGVTAEFYLAPMERASSPGMTWYVFAAQRLNPVTAGGLGAFLFSADFPGGEGGGFLGGGGGGSF